MLTVQRADDQALSRRPWSDDELEPGLAS